jgi:hypothetical protein
MIAIFHSITNYEVKQTVDIQMQVWPLRGRELTREDCDFGDAQVDVEGESGGSTCWGWTVEG